MTDARFPERWLTDRRVLQLSDAGFRLFVVGMAWSVSNRSDGIICDADLRLMPFIDPACADELVRNGLWKRKGRGRWLITDFAATQSSRDVLDALEGYRRSEREKKARQRLKASECPRDIPRDVPGEARRGEARRGEAPQPSHDENRTPAPACAREGEGGDGDPVPCDRCATAPSRIDGSGTRRCRGCAPRLWGEPPAAGCQQPTDHRKDTQDRSPTDRPLGGPLNR